MRSRRTGVRRYLAEGGCGFADVLFATGADEDDRARMGAGDSTQEVTSGCRPDPPCEGGVEDEHRAGDVDGLARR